MTATSRNEKVKEHNDDEKKCHVLSKEIVYDATIPRNDPKFLAPVRRWEKRMGFVTAILWDHVFYLASLHAAGLIWPFLCWNIISWKLILFSFFMGGVGGFGVTAGAHRYWTHRSYKATLPFQIILMYCFASAGQNKVFDWVRDHRVHHKLSESDADPHDVRRGFFFSHIGWLMMKKHPRVIAEGRKIYMDDIHNDTLVQICTRHFTLIQLICCIIIPTVVPVAWWGEGWLLSFLANITRYTLNLNFTWAVNSFAHLWGNKPYDPNIMPVENWGVSLVAMGEGWHNYHHTFPWDYKAAELSYFLNFTTLTLDAFAAVGWVYDRKQASPALIQSVVEQTKQNGN
ncbi:acyl-CoA Delta-9 desaturase-like [Aricia agestis]|uniref:acyl-CoA Delta-9 desaturase-like n=1 Tax=Aricia agestis TaxID=91739 RepID=UPI001C2078CF|nr:acyl-CoA Delta-9 desaturase-like [Aricia agestis]